MRTKVLITLISGLLLIGLIPTSPEAATDYRLGVGDVLRITVYDHPDLTTVARIDSEGQILFPLTGSIRIGGMTTAEASRAVAARLNGEYIVNPQVSIFIEEFRSKKVVVIGEVVRPGLYELSGPTTLLELISKAGGLTPNAGGKATIQRQGGSEGETDQTFSVAMEELLEDGRMAAAVPLRDGDTVTVAKAGLVYVTGQVNRPAAYALEPGTTVIKAITMAGGFTQLAAQSKVRIIRKQEGREQTLKNVSLHEELQAGDVMVVPESFF